MRLFLFIFLFIFGLSILGITSVFMPYHIYQVALDEGVESDYLKIPASDMSFHQGESYQLNKVDGVYSKSDSLWKSFHFSHFNIPLPLRHPFYLLVPKLSYRSSRDDILGARFLGPRQKELGYFEIDEKFKFQVSFNKQKLFLLPIYKNFILKKSQKEIWKDLFTKNINLPDKGELGFFTYLNNSIWPITYSELVYNLFLLQMRQNIFPKELRKIAYYENRNLGVAEVKGKGIDIDSDEQYKREIYYLIEDGFVYSFLLVFDKHRIEAEALRKKIINKIEFKQSTKDSAIPISARYKQLEHLNQVDQEGMTYLLASFTHISQDEEAAKSYLKRMIRFLERGQRNMQHITPLYNYSYNRFGSTFSSFKDKLREKASEKYERVKEEALNKEVDAEKSRDISAEEKFVNDEAKIKFFLDKAKESGEDSDDDDNTLIAD